MSADGDGFLSRWSRRKAQLRGDGPAAASVEAEVAPTKPSPEAKPPTEPSTPSPAASTTSPLVPPAPAEPGFRAPAALPLPTLDDVAQLTRTSDYARFVQPGVDSGVKNAALKKLFSDPHFNVMDGLDTYIDDYGKPDPIPLSMLRKMNQARALGLFDHEEEKAATSVAPVQASTDGEAAGAVAESEPVPEIPAPAGADEAALDDDPDLRLQPDDAARRPGPEPGPRG